MKLLAIILLMSGTAILSQYFNKKLLYVESVHRVVNYMYIVCFFLSSLLFLFSTDYQFSLWVFLTGAVNAIALLYFGRAVKISLSQTFILFPLSGLIPVLLSAFFLGEFSLFSLQSIHGLITIIGLFLVFGAISLFGYIGNNPASYREWLRTVALYFLLVGLINFFMKFFDRQGIDLIDYLFSWYSGTFIASFLPRISRWDWGFTLRDYNYLKDLFFLSSFTLITMAVLYYSLHVIPAAIIFPLYDLFYVFGAVLVGLFLFKEGHRLNKEGWIVLSFGLIGACLLIAGIYT